MLIELLQLGLSWFSSRFGGFLTKLFVFETENSLNVLRKEVLLKGVT